MPPTRRSVEDRLSMAKSNGFVPDTTIPKARDRAVTGYTLKRRQEVLRLWNGFLEQCKLPEKTEPTENLCKNFLNCYVASTTGRIAEKVSRTSVISLWKYCVGALGLSEETSREGYKYIDNELDLSREKQIRHLVSGNDINNLLRQLWANDSFEYLCPRTRIQIALWLCLQSTTGQRGGTFSESGCYSGSNESLWYKDTQLYLAREDDGSEVLHLQVGMRFRKGARQYARSMKLQDLPSVDYYEHDDPVRNVVLYFIVLALADDAFKGVQTIDDIVKTKIPPRQRIWVFDWKESIGETPVFQRLDKDGGTGESMTYASIKGLMVKLGHRTGYSGIITMHGIRRAFLNSVNTEYSIARRNQIAGHSGNMFEESYQSSVSSVDGYAIMTGKTAKAGHTSLLQSMALFHHHDTPTRLTKKMRDKMLEDKEYSSLVSRIDELCKLLRKDRDNTDLDNERARLYNRKTVIERKRLREYQKAWSQQNQLDRTNHGIDSNNETVRSVSDFSILRPFLPERDRLADSLFVPSYIRDVNGQQILQDLFFLANTKKSATLYRPGEEPVDGKCPFNDCGQEIQKIDRIRRASHIHNCHKQELYKQQFAPYAGGSRYVRRAARKSAIFTEFCYYCNQWILSKEDWLEDCKQHLIDPPTYCNSLYYQRLVIRPGLCPFCLGNEDMSAEVRFKTFERKCDQDAHVQEHLRSLEQGKELFCPHPKCKRDVKEETLMEHFEYIHAIESSSRNGIEAAWGKRKRDADSEETKPLKKKASRRTNNSDKSQNKHIDSSSLDDQLEDLKHNDVPPLDDQFEHSNGSSPDQPEDFSQESLFVDGWEKGWEKSWENFLDTDQCAAPYYDTDVINVGSYFHPTY